MAIFFCDLIPETWEKQFPLLDLAFPTSQTPFHRHRYAGRAAGKIPVDNVNWLQLFVNTATFVMLAVIWVEIKKINRQIGRELRRRSTG